MHIRGAECIKSDVLAERMECENSDMHTEGTVYVQRVTYTSSGNVNALTEYTVRVGQFTVAVEQL